jgi:GNAT superfamily N-acetyltransferase
MDFTIRQLNKIQLKEFIDSNEFRTMPSLPISYHRAISHIHNPRAKDDDILLLIAYDTEHKLLGYLGGLPEYMYYEKEKYVKVTGLSCFWTDPLHRGKGIGKSLLNEYKKITNGHLLGTDYSKDSEYLFQNTGCCNVVLQRKEVRLYYHSTLHKVLIRRKPLLRYIKPLLHFTDFLINTAFRLIHHHHKLDISRIKWEFVKEIDDESEKFILRNNKNDLFRRNKAELEWMLNYPWIISSSTKDNRYYFSSVEKLFEFRAMKLYNTDGEMIAFLIFAQRNSTLSIPHSYYEDADIDLIIHCILYHIEIWNIELFRSTDQRITNYLFHNKINALFKKRSSKDILLSKKLAAYLAEGYNIQDGAIDVGFV